LGLFTNTTESKRTCLYLSEDDRAFIMTLPLRSKLLVQEKDDKPLAEWPHDARLLTYLKLKGPKDKKFKDFGKVYPISARNAIFDPVGATGDEMKGTNLWTWMKGTATDEFHTASGKKAYTVMEKLAIPLSIAAGIMVVIISLIGAWKIYD